MLQPIPATITIADLPDICIPQEMAGLDAPAGTTWSIHYYGEEAGTVLEWDGRRAADLRAEDEEQAIAAGSPEDGGLEVCEVRVLLITADGAKLMDRA